MTTANGTGQEQRSWGNRSEIITAATAVVAVLVTVGVALWTLNRTLDDNRSNLKATLEQNRRLLDETLEEGRNQSFAVAGTEMCVAFREQVIALREAGLSVAEIEEFFKGEPGEREQLDERVQQRKEGKLVKADVPYKPYDGYTVPGGLRDGCGAIERLAANIPRGPAETSER